MGRLSDCAPSAAPTSPPPKPPTHPWLQATPVLTIAHPCMGRMLWQNYLSKERAPAPDARRAWLAGLAALAAGATRGRPV
jgi:hypothetical protein